MQWQFCENLFKSLIKKLLLQPYINAALDLDIELIFYALERTLKGEWIFA